MAINWFGLEEHPTDSYIHWKQKNKVLLAEAKMCRAAYDKIIAAGLKEELDILTGAAREEGITDEREANAGPES